MVDQKELGTNGHHPPHIHPVQLSDNARTVLTRRYLRKGKDGQPVESVEEMFWRVAWNIAAPEDDYKEDRQAIAEQFYDLLTTKRFFPNSPTFTGAGTPLGQLAACFVIPLEDDMGRDEAGIFQTLRNAALIQQTGGGNGFSFTRLRPKGARVYSSGGTATGPVGFLRVYDQAFGEVAQGGTRRGANMAVLRVDHPDIREFITCKTDENAITNFNISVGITDDFMQAVERDSDFELVNPQDGSVWHTVKARELFDLIVKQAHHNGEPGLLFLDTANKDNPVPQLYQIEATNPCVTGDTLVATPSGWRRADRIDEGDEICTVLGTGRVATIEVHQAMPVFAIRFSDGGSLRVTASHRFYARKQGDEDGFQSYRLDELAPGDWVQVIKEPVPVFHSANQGRMEIDTQNGRLIQASLADLAEPVTGDSAQIVDIHPAGVETVFDLYEPESDTWITEGYVSQGCGEQFLGPFENCCLGSVNLAEHITADGKVDWEKLQASVELSTRFLDDVVDANAYVESVPQLEAAARRVRRLGLGIMGLGDLMYHLGVRYGSEEGQEFASQVMEFVHYHAMHTSVELAKKRGSFLAIQGSYYDPDDLKWEIPEPLTPYTRDWGRPALDWAGVEQGIREHGIRNGAQTTIAPTGTIATVSGCEGYGCEPVFALAYTRHFNDNGKDVELQYTSPQFEQALIDAGLDEITRKDIIKQVNQTGSCQNVDAIPKNIRHTFVVAADISAEEHVRMQASMQRFVSNAISKTCNFPADATPDDVAKAYQLAWKLGCKGLTVYVAGSRDKVVLETAATVQKKDSPPAEEKPKSDSKPRPKSRLTGTLKPEITSAASLSLMAEMMPPQEPELPLFVNETKRPRARVLKGYTYRVETPAGTTFVTINENGGDQPFEVFIQTAKAGSETAAVSEALGRLISYTLRMNSHIEPRKRLVEVVRQLRGIGGGRSLGLGPNRVRSLPDGVAQVLDEYLQQQWGEHPHQPTDEAEPEAATPSPGQLSLPGGLGNPNSGLGGDLCPECGHASVVNEEGCRKCYSCGYSEC